MIDGAFFILCIIILMCAVYMQCLAARDLKIAKELVAEARDSLTVASKMLLEAQEIFLAHELIQAVKEIRRRGD